ncbi:hypothetical protein PG995_012714 [Apiospora arundinis]
MSSRPRYQQNHHYADQHGAWPSSEDYSSNSQDEEEEDDHESWTDSHDEDDLGPTDSASTAPGPRGNSWARGVTTTTAARQQPLRQHVGPPGRVPDFGT